MRDPAKSATLLLVALVVALGAYSWYLLISAVEIILRLFFFGWA